MASGYDFSSDDSWHNSDNSDSSIDGNELPEYEVCVGVKGYQFEPLRRRNSTSGSHENSSENRESAPIRVGNTDWLEFCVN